MLPVSSYSGATTTGVVATLYLNVEPTNNSTSISSTTSAVIFINATPDVPNSTTAFGYNGQVYINAIANATPNTGANTALISLNAGGGGYTTAQESLPAIIGINALSTSSNMISIGGTTTTIANNVINFGSSTQPQTITTYGNVTLTNSSTGTSTTTGKLISSMFSVNTILNNVTASTGTLSYSYTYQGGSVLFIFSASASSNANSQTIGIKITYGSSVNFVSQIYANTLGTHLATIPVYYTYASSNTTLTIGTSYNIVASYNTTYTTVSSSDFYNLVAITLPF